MAYFTKKRGAVGWPGPQAKAIVRAIEAMGFDADSHQAQTGTIYIETDIGDEDYRPVKIRVADHGECYCSEDVTCDPQGYTARQTIEWLAREASVDVPASVLRGWKSAETRKANAAKKQQAEAFERQRKAAALLKGVADIRIDSDGWPETFVEPGSEFRKTRIIAAQTAIRAAYKEVN